MSYSLNLDFGGLDSEDLKTEESIREAARTVMPQAIRQLAEAAGRTAWDSTLRQMKKAGLKVTASASERSKFLRESVRNFEASLKPSERQEIEQTIVEHIKARLKEIG